MLGNLTGWHLVIILVVIVLLFGSTKLPALAKSVGQSMRIFKGEVKTMKEESATDRRDDADRRPSDLDDRHRADDRYRADDRDRYRADDRARDAEPREYVRPGEPRRDDVRYDAPRADGDTRPSV